MRIPKKFLILSSLLILFTSCDPSHDILFKNKTASNVKVKISLEPDAMDDLRIISTKDLIVFDLKKDSVAMISFGIGNWSGKELHEAVKSIKAIEIETNDIKTIYKSKNAITDILDKNVHGVLFKSLIQINIE